MYGIHSSGNSTQTENSESRDAYEKVYFQRCGGNSNNFESEMHCTATCLKAMFNI